MTDIATTSAGPPPADVLLADGSIAVIRPVTVDDRAGLDALHLDVSDESLRFRFFATSRRSGPAYVTHIYSDDGPAACLVATVLGRVVAVATAEPDGSPDSAEVAFLVADPLHGHGLGSLLLEHLAAAARSLGILRFHAEVLGDNTAMKGVFAAAGFRVTRRTSTGVATVEMETEASAQALAAADVRESQSEARSLASLLRPSSVAVVGVRRDGTGVGRAVLRSIREAGFTGVLSVVHATEDTIDGLPTVRCLADVPGHVDVAVVAVPAAATPEVLADAVAAGVSTFVLISSGFGELGSEGAALQRRLVRVAREHSIRLVGPNCLGVLVNDPDIRLNATFTARVPQPGGLAIASQSGGVGIVMLDLATRLGLGVASFVSLGNKADVSGNDLLAAWLDDPRVSTAALYLESFGNAVKFARVARRFSERKPLLAVMGGRSAGGHRAGASHTAAAATLSVGVDALFDQSGVIACPDAETMTETALLLTEQPRPAGGRLGIVTNAGGLGVLAADSAERLGLDVPVLSTQLQHRLGVEVPGTGAAGNPVDLGAAASASVLGSVVEQVLASGEIDVLLVPLVATSVIAPAPLLDALQRARRRYPQVPVLLVALGGAAPPSGTLTDITVLPSIEAALGAVARVVRYTRWLAVTREEPVAHDEQRAREARELAARLGAPGDPGEGWLDHGAVTQLLGPYGLGPLGVVADSRDDAVDVAAELGLPVALKVADPSVVHKTDRGLVRTAVSSSTAVRETVDAFAAELGATDVAVLVQPMVSGVELALGIVRDPVFGPLVMVAAGGVGTEVWDDRVFLLTPVGAGDAARAVRALRLWPLLQGHRGSARLDVEAVEALLVAVGRLAEDVPLLSELDLNPVVVMEHGTALIDVKVRLARSPLLHGGVPRQLRPTP